MCNLRLENVRLVVCTHAHSDHYGQAATIVERAGCELWMHPNHQHATRMAGDPEAALARRLEIARQSGVPEEPLRRYASERRSIQPRIAAPIEPDRPLRGRRGASTPIWATGRSTRLPATPRPTYVSSSLSVAC